MKIRKYQPADKEQVIELVSRIFGNIFNGDPAQFKLLKEFDVTQDYVLFLVTEIDNKIVGTMALKKIDDAVARLKRMYVSREYRRRGIGQKMLDLIIKFAKQNGYKKILLHTYPIMENARRFYKRNGFIESEGDDPEQIHVVREL